MNIIRYVLDCIELHQYAPHWLGSFWYGNSTDDVLNSVRNKQYSRYDIETIVLQSENKSTLILICTSLMNGTLSSTFRYISTEYNIEYVDLFLEKSAQEIRQYFL